MLTRIVGGAAAAALSFAAMTGIGALIAFDIAGSDLMARAWNGLTTPPADPLASAIEGTSDITFFVNEPIEGTRFKVTTGFVFSTPEDLAGGRPTTSWCYINAAVNGRLPRHISLMNRRGSGPAVLAEIEDYDTAELGDLGLTKAQLRTLAHSHCRFEDWRDGVR
jgi:hypothetical protein